MSSEDVLSAADIAAGGVSAALGAMFPSGRAPLGGLWVPPPTALPPKVERVMNWLSDNTQPLRRLVVAIDEDLPSRGLRSTHLQFHGSAELLVP